MEHAIIVDVEASTAVRQPEVTAAKTMIERTHDRFDLWPERLIADTGYGSAEMLNWLVHQRGIEPHIPVFDNSKRADGTFSREEFTYDHKSDNTHSRKWSWLKAWGVRVAQRRGIRQAIVAVARRLAVVLHRMWVDGSEFRWSKDSAAVPTVA